MEGGEAPSGNFSSPLSSAYLRLRPVHLPPPGHVFSLQQHRVLQRGREGGDIRRDARERDVRGDPRKPVDEEQRRDPEEGSRDQTLHHQPEGCGEVHQIRGHGPEPSLHTGEPQVRTPTQRRCFLMSSTRSCVLSLPPRKRETHACAHVALNAGVYGRGRCFEGESTAATAETSWRRLREDTDQTADEHVPGCHAHRADALLSSRSATVTRTFSPHCCYRRRCVCVCVCLPSAAPPSPQPALLPIAAEQPVPSCRTSADCEPAGKT